MRGIIGGVAASSEMGAMAGARSEECSDAGSAVGGKTGVSTWGDAGEFQRGFFEVGASQERRGAFGGRMGASGSRFWAGWSSGWSWGGALRFLWLRGTCMEGRKGEKRDWGYIRGMHDVIVDRRVGA